MNLKDYKPILRQNKITHQYLADTIGHTRESVTLWLNGKEMPEISYNHIKKEIDELILQSSNK